MYLIDTRKYDDSFLLAKILEKVDITDEEKKKLFKHFEKPEVVDAEPVVRCKDCKWCHGGYCEKADDIIPFGFAHHKWENFYCAWGERKEDE